MSYSTRNGNIIHSFLQPLIIISKIERIYSSKRFSCDTQKAKHCLDPTFSTVFSRKSKYPHSIYALTEAHLAHHYFILTLFLGCGSISEQAISYATLLLYMPIHFSFFLPLF